MTGTQSASKLTLVQAVNRGLHDMMSDDDRVVVIGEDIGLNGGVFRATDKLLEKYGKERVIDTPIAESGIVGVSVGLAIAGFRPVAEIQFMGFIYPAINQLFSHVARMRNRTRGLYTMPLVVRMPYGGGIHAPEHHSESYEAILAHTPGLVVVMPSTPYDAKGLMISSIRSDDPVVFLEPKRIYRSMKEEVPDDIYEVPIGKARLVSEGKDVTLIAYGAMVKPAIEARNSLEQEGIDVEVLDLRTVMPLDIETIINSVTKTGRLVIVHEAPRTCGIASEITSLVNERALLHLLAPVVRVTGFDTVFPYALLEKHYLPTRDRIITGIKQTLDF